MRVNIIQALHVNLVPLAPSPTVLDNCHAFHAIEEHFRPKDRPAVKLANQAGMPISHMHQNAKFAILDGSRLNQPHHNAPNVR